jgi:hypothetical protein
MHEQDFNGGIPTPVNDDPGALSCHASTFPFGARLRKGDPANPISLELNERLFYS